MRNLTVLAFVAVIAGCTRAEAPAPREYVFTDSVSHTEYRMRVDVDREKSLVRMSVSAPTPEIAVWGKGGSFPHPIVSTCKVFDGANWECSNVNTALTGKDGFGAEVGRLEMHQGVLAETPLFAKPRTYAERK